MKKIKNTMNPTTTLLRKLLLIILLAPVIITGKTSAADYYWVGGTGNWSDFANHWATASGGTTFHTVVPSPADNVFFDANSFSTSGQSANLDVTPVYCKNFDWQNTITGTDFVTPDPNNTINIFGSLNIGVKITFTGIFSFTATTSGNTISISDTLDCSLDFNNPLGSWIINSPIVIIKDITLQGGTLNTNNFDITTRSFRSDFGTPGRTLLPGTSVFTIVCSAQIPFGDWFIDNGLSFNGTNTDLNFRLPTDTVLNTTTFRLLNSNSVAYRNVNLNATAPNGSFVNSFLEMSADFAAHSLKTYNVHIINMWLVKAFQVDTVLFNDSISYINLNMGSFDTITMNVNYWESSGLVTMFGGNIDKIVHNGDMYTSIGMSIINPPTFMRDVSVTGNFLSNVTSSGNLSIGKLVLGGGATITGHLFVDTMMIGTSQYCNITAGDTLTVNKLFIAQGTPGSYFQFHSGTTGSQGTVIFIQGNVCSDYLMVQDINAVGSNLFAGANSFDLGGNTGWSFTSCPAALNYYWVGGTGNWNDFANHWATTSGGTTFHTGLPTPNDDVYFDVNSFSNPGDTVYINVTPIFCNNMDWTNVINNPVFSYTGGSKAMNVYGSVLLSGNMTCEVYGSLNFKATTTGHTFKTSNVHFKNTAFNFDGIGGEWTLQDSLISETNGMQNINFSNGTFNSNDNAIYVDKEIYLTSSANSFVNMGYSIITCNSWTCFLNNSGNFSLSKIICSQSSGDFNPGTNNIYNEIISQAYSAGGPVSYGNSVEKLTCSIINVDSNNIKEAFLSLPGTHNISGTGNFFSKVVFSGAQSNIQGNHIFDTLFFATPGQVVTLLDTQTINNLFITNATVSNPISISGGLIIKNSGTVCLDYINLSNSTVTGGATFYAGANSIDLGGNTGWNFSSCSPAPVSDVWPGDANYDLTANNNDVLNIGLAYGETGPVRSGASLSWVAQPATDWSSFFLSAVNKKHADCDGNGVVDNNDTAAISLNYGSTHLPRLAGPNSNQSITSPPLYLEANPDTAMEGDTIEVDIFLGTQTIPVDSIYGIAFSIIFDPALIDTTYMPFDFTGSWMGIPGVDLLPFNHVDFSVGKADVALTRTDQNNIGGFGYLGKMGAVIVDNVGTRLASGPPYVTLPLSVSDITALTVSEFYLTITAGLESVEIDTIGITGVHSTGNTNLSFNVYPNPVNKKLNVFSPWLQGETICTFELDNVIGEKIIAKQIPVNQNQFSVDLGGISNGIYFIKVATSKGTANKKILIEKK